MEITYRDQTVAHAAMLSLTLTVVLRTAWISNDSIDTLRSAVNFIHGSGAIVHLGDRAQPFIHPLWFLLISGATLITGNAFAATFALSITLSLITVSLLISQIATSFWAGMLAGLALLLSKAYIDFSTSGLENSLSHFLLVAGVLLGLESFASEHGEALAAGSLVLLLSIYLCRPDLLLLVLPFCLVVLVRSYHGVRRSALLVAIALSPVLCWSLFSHFYYGSVLPDGAFAKIQAVFAGTDSIRQGIVYLLDSFSADPSTLTVTTIAIFLTVRQSVELQAIGAGTVLYIVYVVIIGGDSMSGRLLTVPLLASAVVISRSGLSALGIASMAAVIVLLGSVSSSATIFAGPKYSASAVPLHGIRDERGVIYPNQGLATGGRGTFKQPDEWTPVQNTVAGTTSTGR
jgi:arabinofuranosyltransferase